MVWSLKPVRETKISNIYRILWIFAKFGGSCSLILFCSFLASAAFPLVLHREGTWRRQDRPRPWLNPTAGGSQHLRPNNWRCFVAKKSCKTWKPETWNLSVFSCRFFVNVYTKGMSEVIFHALEFSVSRFLHSHVLSDFWEKTQRFRIVWPQKYLHQTHALWKKTNTANTPNTLPFPPPFVASLLEKRFVPSISHIQQPGANSPRNWMFGESWGMAKMALWHLPCDIQPHLHLRLDCSHELWWPRVLIKFCCFWT